ncbi:hypothetical protein B0H21DRAFT_821480 [Amylocystis lapponica]|nr:hypothetical protein B0H21DRAFT_821480 [Amylocystis lapponica]
MEITLTDAEDQLCTLLDDCTKNMKESQGLETSCRIAGGWVRDKLLGLQSNDIDIALTDMMGVAFAEHLVEYCSSVKQLAVKGITKIESNPDQSKHLETAKTTILGLDLDIVNLRSEEYAEDSRIPTQVTFGTPLQDALRRDITINALFYNVHSRSVEDHTGKGLDDLKNGIVRTPLAPKETFMDDPLRVIRCVRFASRFGFEMVPDLENAARDPDIQEALVSKISKERVGEEIDKMMKGRDPLRAVQLINSLSLFSSIFSIPQSIQSKMSAPPEPPYTSLAAASILSAFLQHPSAPSWLSLPPVHPLLLSETPALPIARLFLACALTPYRNLTYVDPKGKPHPVVEAALRDGLKLGTQNHYLDGIPALFAAAAMLHDAVPHSPAPDAQPDRVTLGLLLRARTVHNPHAGATWATSLLFALVQDLVALCDAARRTVDADAASARIAAYNALAARVDALGLREAVDAKPVLDGREVVRALGVTPGAWTGQVLARVVEWQLRHPEEGKDACEAWLKAEYAAGRIGVRWGPAPANKRGKEGDAGSMAKKARR